MCSITTTPKKSSEMIYSKKKEQTLGFANEEAPRQAGNKKEVKEAEGEVHN